MDRILDYLLDYLLQVSKDYTYLSEKGVFFYYVKAYDTQVANTIFRKLHTLCKGATEIFIKYISSSKISSKMLQTLGKNEYKTTYLELLKYLSMKFMTGCALESISFMF